MSQPPPARSMKTVYGKAFLIQLDKGDVELATVFAKAFLMSRNGPENQNNYL